MPDTLSAASSTGLASTRAGGLSRGIEKGFRAPGCTEEWHQCALGAPKKAAAGKQKQLCAAGATCTCPATVETDADSDPGLLEAEHRRPTLALIL